MLKGLLETEEAEILPTQWMHLIPLTQVFFIFRSGSVNNNWMNIYSFVEDLVKKFEKYGFSKLQGIFPCQAEYTAV